MDIHVDIEPAGQHYRVVAKSWIPQAAVVDPGLPIPIPYRLSTLPPLAQLSPNCWAPPGTTAATIQVSSSFHGDGHAPFDGPYRAAAAVTFDWDGSAISNLALDDSLPRVGATVRTEQYTVTVAVDDEPVLTGIENDAACLSATDVAGLAGAARLLVGRPTRTRAR